MRPRHAVTCTAAAVIAVLAFGELAHWRASWRGLGGGESAGRSEAVVVLGYANKGRRANYLNRYRVRAGIRSIDPAARESTLVLCGGAVAGEHAEADLMAQYARERGFTGRILRDRDSRSTWQNVQNAIPLIEGADAIKIVSNSQHAEKARGYLWQLRPDLARRLTRGEDYCFGELTFVKPFAAFLGLWKLRRLRAKMAA